MIGNYEDFTDWVRMSRGDQEVLVQREGGRSPKESTMVDWCEEDYSSEKELDSDEEEKFCNVEIKYKKIK